MISFLNKSISGKFKKMYKSKRTSELLQEIEANEIPANGGAVKLVQIQTIFLSEFSHKSFQFEESHSGG